MTETNKTGRGGYKHDKEGIARLRATPIEELDRLHSSGQTLAQIAALFGVGPESIGKRFRKAGRSKGKSHNLAGVRAFKALPESLLRSLYASGLSTLEIGARFGVGHTVVLRWFDKLGLERRWHDDGAVFKNLKMLIPLAYEQQQLLLGGLLGDACLSHREFLWKSGKKAHCKQVCFSQGHAQRDYLEHKRQLLLKGRESLPKPCVSKVSKSTSSASVGHWGGEVFQFAFSHTPTLEKFEADYELRNSLGKVYVTPKWADSIDPLGFTYWFLDDGCLQTTHSNKAHSLMIATCAYDAVELDLLLGIFYRLGATSARLNFRREGQYVIQLNRKAEVLHLREMMLQHTPDCMRYKLKEI